MQVDDDCCALPQTGSCRVGYRYSRGAVCWRGWGCKGYETCCEKCEDPFSEDCQHEGGQYGEKITCNDYVPLLLFVVFFTAVCCICGGLGMCMVNRRRQHAFRIEYGGRDVAPPPVVVVARARPAYELATVSSADVVADVAEPAPVARAELVDDGPKHQVAEAVL